MRGYWKGGGGIVESACSPSDFKIKMDLLID